ncbi:MAG: hypothetical protein HYX43_12715 [Burkholderiales bacterium]|nr:hypothetical protein [Burkholderiales bacterium]
MTDTVLLYASGKEKSGQPAVEPGVGDTAAKELLVLSAAAFRVTYCAPVNKSMFDPDVSQHIKEAIRVYAALISSDAKPNAVDRVSQHGWRVICPELQFSWNAIRQVHEISEPYANLLMRLNATEEKCVRIDRNDIRARELRESYEYLDREIERLDRLLKQIRLTDA